MGAGWLSSTRAVTGSREIVPCSRAIASSLLTSSSMSRSKYLCLIRAASSFASARSDLGSSSAVRGTSSPTKTGITRIPELGLSARWISDRT